MTRRIGRGMDLNGLYPFHTLTRRYIMEYGKPTQASIVEHNLARTAYKMAHSDFLILRPALLYGDDRFTVHNGETLAVVKEFTRQELIDAYTLCTCS